MGRWILSLVLVASACAALAVASCPDATHLSPCTCDDEGINCRRAQSTSQLRQAFESGDALSREHKELWIQKTPLTSFTAGVLGNFKFEKVHVEHNANLSFFTLDSLTTFKELLNVLSLYGNALQTFEFDKLLRFPYLVSLNLGRNRLRSIPANAFRSIRLHKLGLRENPITSIGQRAFYALPNLKELDLSRTRLNTLGPYSLSILRAHPELRIQLNDADISVIHSSAFDYAAPLVLNLANNSLATLEQNPFEPLIGRMYQNAKKFNTIPLVSVAGNPLTCRGCAYKWLVPHRYSTLVRAILHGFRCPDGFGLTSISDQKIACWKNFWNFANIG
uniref:Putative membrane glycoprotein lig-1 ixodes scapularis membrane glycoprotein lig-1 n=1 Tax=Rhipicephalus microplus TaxID=6941 RepID=A0A6M2CIW2_RHIMP